MFYYVHNKRVLLYICTKYILPNLENEYMTPLQVEKTIRHYIDGRFKNDNQTLSERLSEQKIKQMCFGDLKLSIQASEYHYCSTGSIVTGKQIGRAHV